MSIFGRGIEASKVYSRGVEVSRVMVGTGGSAVEVWPGIYDVSMDFNFPNQDELKWAPVTGFDPRTSASSAMAPAFVFNNMLVAGNNDVASYNVRLINHQIDQLPIEFIVTLGDVLNTLTYPSSIILASNIIFSRMIVAEFGSDGFRVFTLYDGSMSPESGYRYSQTYSPGDQLLVRLEADRVIVGKLNGSQTGFVFPADLATIRSGDGRYYVGFGMFSTASRWSSRIERIQLKAKTTYKTVLVASEALAKITIPSNSWTEVARSTIPMGGVTQISLIGASWPQASSNDDRLFRIKVNGVVIGTTTDEGGSLALTGRTLSENSVVTVEAFAATSNSSYRKVSGGILQIGDPSLPT